MPTTRRISLPLTVALAAVLLAAAAHASAPFKPVPRGALHVTSGAIATLASGLLQTPSAEMRATARDHGHHARSALLRFTYRRATDEVETLGSGAVRTQIGLKLQANDPCNLVYVMWREEPVHSIVVSVKRNPGQTTSTQCGNRGYTDVATVPLATDPAVRGHATHRLQARTTPRADGSMSLTVLADGETVVHQRLTATLTSGLSGPIGVRSDNGVYRFALSAKR
jgi:hypothetical protein